MSKKYSFCVIGLGRFGLALAQTLAQRNVEVLAIEIDEGRARELRPFTENVYVAGDVSLNTLREAGVQNCDTVCICIGDKIEASILATLHVSQLGVRHIIAKAASEDHGNILKTLGARVIYPERDSGVRLGKRLTSESALDFISLSEEFDITEFRLSAKFSGQTIESVNIRKKFTLNIIALVRGENTIIEIDPKMILQEGDVLAVVGRKENLSRFEDFLNAR